MSGLFKLTNRSWHRNPEFEEARARRWVLCQSQTQGERTRCLQGSEPGLSTRRGTGGEEPNKHLQEDRAVGVSVGVVSQSGAGYIHQLVAPVASPLHLVASGKAANKPCMFTGTSREGAVHLLMA